MVVDEDFKPNTPTRGGGRSNTAYSYFVKECKEEHKRRFPDEQLPMAEFNRKATDRWKNMSEREKKWFNILAENGRKDASDFSPRTPSDGAKRGRKPRSKKDPNAPKRALSGFFWFSNDERPKVKAANPDFGVGDIAKELGRRWSEATEEIKAKYEAKAANDRVRYDREKMAYQSKMKGGGMSDSLVLDDEDDDD